MKMSKRGGRGVIKLDSSSTFQNFRFSKNKIKKGDKVNKTEQNGSSEIRIKVSDFEAMQNNFKTVDSNFSDLDSNLTSISQVYNRGINFRSKTYKPQKIMTHNKPTRDSESYFTNISEEKSYSFNGNESTLSSSTTEHESDESFLTIVSQNKNERQVKIPKDALSNHPKPLRLFNKNGKPLTDQAGRPLLNILGQPLVLLDGEGRVISDSRGNQVFNSRGESAIYSSTNLFIPPTENEPGVPLLDVDKKHILFLYDSKGHPLIDSLGRPLSNASGKLMFGMDSKEKINLSHFKMYPMKNIYSKAPLENVVRRVQILDSELKPLTNEYGISFEKTRIICNKNGMPVCDGVGRPLYFKYGAQITSSQLPKSSEQHNGLIKESSLKIPQSSTDPISEENVTTENDTSKEVNAPRVKSDLMQPTGTCTSGLSCSDKNKPQVDVLPGIPNLGNKYNNHKFSNNFIDTPENTSIESKTNKNKKKALSDKASNENIEYKGTVCSSISSEGLKDLFHNSQISSKNINNNQHENRSKEAIVLFDASKRMENQKSSLCTTALKNIRGKQISHSIVKRNTNKKMYTSNFIEYFKNALNLTSLKQTQSNKLMYNDYGKPLKDFYGNLLYDKFGVPLTGAQGKKLGEKARHALRIKLRHIPVVPVINNEKLTGKEKLLNALTYTDSHDQFGDPFYDKHGRPLYDLYGKLIYDVYGRPLTDAFGRPLIDGIGQPLMDSEGNVLTSVSNSPTNVTLTDIFGRRLYDKHGRSLFDSYGRPRYDIFTNAIYDNCSRPAMDGNGNILFDFLNRPIQPQPEKPLYKNARGFLPKYIDKILAMPSMHRVLKYSRASLKDVFGGPLFDDFGRPLYNKIGKPLYDKYGRPLYDKDGKPLCDCYGRPLSEEIRQSPDDQTLSVVDSLKLLKLTKESSQWMEIKRSQTQDLKRSDADILGDAIVMKVVQPAKKKSTQFTYALTRVTRFSCGRQALEILEAPLSAATAFEMHHLPVDNKPLIMVAQRRQRIIKKRRTIKHH